MGIHDFSKAFKNAFVGVADLKDVVAGRLVIIDAHLCLCKSIKALGHQALTDPSGVPTAGINNMLDFIPKLRKAGAAKIIATFDNPEKNPFKEAEYIRRGLLRDECTQRAADAPNADIKENLETRAWSIDAAVIWDAQNLLKLFDVDVHIAPIGFEAEHYAAHLANIGFNGLPGIVISDDTDTVMFGAPMTLMPRTGKVEKSKSKYSVVQLSHLLTVYSLTLIEFRRVCITLGCDFIDRTPGCGPVTALTRGKNIKPSDDQQRIIDYVSSIPNAPALIIPGQINIAALATWLSESKGFNYARVAKKLGLSIATGSISSLVIMPSTAGLTR